MAVHAVDPLPFSALSDNAFLGGVIAVAVSVGALGLVMVFRWGNPDRYRLHEEWRTLGASLITGVAVTLAVFALQLRVDERNEEEEFRLRVAFSGNLSGFDPEGHTWPACTSGARSSTARSSPERISPERSSRTARSSVPG